MALNAALLNTLSPGSAWTAGGAAGVGTVEVAGASSRCWSSGTSAGNTSQPNCSSTVYARTFSTRRQLSIEPVGHGGMQARQWLHLAGSTT